MTRASSYQLSTHAVSRALERTSLSPGSLIDRIDGNAVAWLPARLPENHGHALVYCGLTDSFVVAILQKTDRVLKTVVTLEQWECMYWKVADIWLALAQHAAAHRLLSPAAIATATDTPPPAPVCIGREPLPAKEPQALDLRLVIKIDGPKGPQYHTILEKTEAQWGTMMGSSPAERRRIQNGFLSKLAKRLLTVNSVAAEVRNRLQRHKELIAQGDNILFVFGPNKYAVNFLPQVDVGALLPAMVDRIAKVEEKRTLHAQVKKERKRQKRLEKTHPSLVGSTMSQQSKEIFAMLIQPNYNLKPRSLKKDDPVSTDA